MEYLKTKFVKLSIERQIQLGVTSVTCCIAIMVVVFTIVNSLVLMNLQYTDFLSVLDQQENDAIEHISFYYENDMNILTDMEKVHIAVINNFLNIHKTYNFISAFVDLPYTNIVKEYSNNVPANTICPNNTQVNCIAYKKLSNFNNDAVFVKQCRQFIYFTFIAFGF